MPGIGSLSFLTPMALAALVALPVLWWLLRLTPPTPRRVRFPAMMILMRLAPGREISAHSPPWLVLLRLALLLAVILATAHPVLNAAGKFSGTGPLSLIVDDGWAAAKAWNQRREIMSRLIKQADREGRPVILTSTAASSVKRQSRMLTAPAAAKVAAAMLPKPWVTDRGPVLKELADKLTAEPPGQIVWLSDGLGDAETKNQIDAVAAYGALNIYADKPGSLPVILYPPETRNEALDLTVSRLEDGRQGTYRVLARDAAGVLLDGVDLSIKAGKHQTTGSLHLPTELRNRLARLEIEGENTAGSVLLIDKRWARHPVGLALPQGETKVGVGQTAQPLLNPQYYLERALQPVGDVRRGTISDLLKRPLAMLILADHGRLRPPEQDQLTRWMKAGGLLLRFAGPILAQAVGGDTQADDRALLLPAPARDGTRTLGGVLSWNKPVALASFAEDSPFFGIPVPADVTVKRQMLTEPNANHEQRIWARLADGTPLISAARKGRGWLVLVHTSADPRWSNLALSGLFVSLLERLAELGQGVDDDPASQQHSLLSPLLTLDGFARLGSPSPEARPITAAEIAKSRPGPDHPPGVYGRGNIGDGVATGYRRTLNLSPGLKQITAFPDTEFVTEYYGERPQIDFRPWLLLAAFVLVIADLIAMIYLKGLFKKGSLTAVALFAVFFATSAGAQNQTDTAVPAATLETRLAYYITGEARQDAKSRAGLRGLSAMVNQRTAAELGSPVGINPETDELAFYPLIYWPLGVSAKALTDEAAERINGYLNRGGTILFDTADGNRGGVNLGSLARRLDLPPLTLIGADHVLGRAFYLLNSFPGRWTGGRLWVESTTERVNDGVSPVIVGGNDWAAAWALDEADRPLYALIPGGQRQRELSFRFGINLVMYVLTGNYKSDQVHLPSIIERLKR